MAEIRPLIVAVTGHRNLTVTPALAQAIDAAIEQFASTARGGLVFASALAEGADRLVPQRGFALGHRRLIVPLPMPTAVYLGSFTSDSSRAEFRDWLGRAEEVVRLPPAPSDVAAYHALGEWLVEHADALIAVWDGLPAQGDGGTGAVVEHARSTGRTPIAWVHVGDSPHVTFEPHGRG